MRQEPGVLEQAQVLHYADPVISGTAPSSSFSVRPSFQRDGRTLKELEGAVPEMTRIGVMKHLRLLEDAGLLVTHRSGRQKLHFLNPVPIQLIHDRWIGKYTHRQAAALADLKTELETPR